MKYEYRVRDQQGRMTSGFLEAEQKNSVVEKLLGQGLYIVSLKETVKSSKNVQIDFKFSARGVNNRDLVVFTQQLSTMMAAGLPIIRCFKILGEQTASVKLRKAILEIKEDIESGLSLWEAMAKHPNIFSGIYISMVRAGELGGVLDQVLESLSHHLERDQEINAKVKSASIYPMIICIFAVLVVIFIISFVMPMFIGIFQNSGGELPLPTRILLGAGALIKKWGIYIVLSIVTLTYCMKRWGKTLNGQLFYDNLYLHLPVIGKVISKIAVARFARTMGTLVKSGIPVLQALEVMEDIVGNAVIGRAITRACNSIREGETINKPLMETGVFEPMVIQMIAVGEETGTLDQILIRMSYYYERELVHTVDALMAVIEPVLILIVAIMVGGVIVATLLPMLDMITMIG